MRRCNVDEPVPGRSPLICAVVTEPAAEACRAAIQEAAKAADIIELRLDYLRDFDFSNPESLRPLLEDKPCPVIITCRATSEGGQQHVADSARLRLLVEGARRMADYCDIEAASYNEAAQLSPDPSRLIVSYHNLTETPAALNAIYDRMLALPAAIHKIVTRANSVTDTLAAFRLLDRARSEGRSLIALAMEEPGLITRVLGPSRGSFLTYGSLGLGRESAPGQVGCEELRNLYRANELSRDTRVTGIIGKYLGHSASPAMHNAAFKHLELDFVYLPIEVEDVAGFFARFVRPSSREMEWNLRGFSVTIPHKTAVVPLLDTVDPAARKIGAVNTVVVTDGGLQGFNTDSPGAMEPLLRVCSPRSQNCALIGAGGAARAVIHGLLEQGARVSVFARDAEKAKPLAEDFEVTVAPLDAFGSSDASIVINATPVGMQGRAEDESPVPRETLRNRRIIYDLVYNPPETLFLRYGREEGCLTIGGIEMLVSQAAGQFELWTNREAPAAVMRDAAMARLRRQARGT